MAEKMMLRRITFIVYVGLLSPVMLGAQTLDREPETEVTATVPSSLITTDDVSYYYVFTMYDDTSYKSVFKSHHYLGEPCATKWNMFQSIYTRTYEQEVGLSNTIVEFEKPAIYHAVRRLNKYIIKSVKKKKLGKKEASALLCHVLDCANAIYYENDTAELERKVGSLKDNEALLDFFEHIKLVKA